MADTAKAHRDRSGDITRAGGKFVGKGPAKIWWGDVKKRTKAIATAPKRLSSKELAERATGMLGAGILKPYAMSQIIVKGGKIARPLGKVAGEQPEKRLGRWVTQTFRTPQRELSRVSAIDPKASLEKGASGIFYPGSREMGLSMTAPHTGSVWHGLAHGRQYGSKEASAEMFRLRNDLLHKLMKKGKFDRASFYERVDPLEIQAREMANNLENYFSKTKRGSISQREYDKMFLDTYRKAMKKATEQGWFEGLQ